MTGRGPKRQQAELAAMRERLTRARGRQFWRGLDELAETAEFQSFLKREFPLGASEFADPIGRRAFLKLMGASLALAGLTACAPAAPEKILPYAGQPDPGLTPGKSLFYATAMPLAGYGTGVLVESHLGRPIKIEGNPLHPASLGATDAFAQASLLELYDPDRSQALLDRGQISTWNAFVASAISRMQPAKVNGGAGLRFLTGAISSPTLGAQLLGLLARFPQARWTVHEPVSRENARAGARLTFGTDAEAIYHFDRADRIFSLESNFLFDLPGHLCYARDFADRRRVAEGTSKMNRLYIVESAMTITGASADHRLPLPAGRIETFARAAARRLGLDSGAFDESGLSAEAMRWLEAAVRDLGQHRGASLVVAGECQPPLVHALAHAMNETLGNVGQTVTYIPPVEILPDTHAQSLADLVADIRAGLVETLFILGSNPVFTAPGDLDFEAALQDVEYRAHLGLYVDETAAQCHWHVPEAHYLETWSDVRAFDGTATIIQPLIAPLYNGRSAHELLAALGGDARPAYDIVRGYWQSQNLSPDFEQFWRRSLDEGVVPGTASAPMTTTVATLPPAPGQGAGPGSSLELNFRPDPSIWDGRFANNGWLQELPKPLTTLTWDNPALIAPATAARLGISSEDEIELRLGDRRLTAAAWIMPGHAEDSITLNLGYGRWRAGRVGEGAGFNAYVLRTAGAPDSESRLEVRRTGRRFPLATTQNHFSVENRDLLRVGTLEEFLGDPGFARREEDGHVPPSLYPEFEYDGYAWGMAIDLSACIGCNACIVACQAENNIPVVGKDQVLNSREMHWLKVDLYHEGEPRSPRAHFQPRLCMHCEKAPCEVVCPVEATLHDDEGLNQMIYNRCVGTRYCSNNCPYKVRRFNFFDYNEDIPVLNLMRNPDVTVRSRGVMEKCTYNIQRIEEARIRARQEGRPIRDGDVLTACQQACPTQAIVFGNINDPNSRVAQLKARPLNYGMLAHLGTQPRTTYLAKVWNPNPEIESP